MPQAAAWNIGTIGSATVLGARSKQAGETTVSAWISEERCS